MEIQRTITTNHGAVKVLGNRRYRFEFNATPTLNGTYEHKTDQEATDAFLAMVELLGGCWVYASDERQVLAYTHSPDLENRANARLIAAAPELLSALERLENSYALMAAGKPVRDMAETLGEVHHALKKARCE